MINLTVSLILGTFIVCCSALWTQELECPLICTCRLEHITETAIKRFLKRKDQVPSTASTDYENIDNNEVLYEEKPEDIELLQQHTHSTVRSAVCILQTGTEPLDLLESFPKDIESLTLIQSYESGNKTIKFSYLNKFTNLIILEIVGPNLPAKPIESNLIVEIDSPLSNIKYLNLERILIRNSKQQIINFLKKIDDEHLTFEYVEKSNKDAQPLTMLQKSIIDEDIVPYEVFKKQRDMNNDTPLFGGFESLYLLRITDCELNSINWEMLDGLKNLKYLILEKNNLKYIPAFSFYGTPNLKDLSLAHNKLLDIQITDLAGLLQLEYLDLSYNNFTQLSELSLPPFPKLKLANFANNPIGVIFPSTFEVMNTTISLVIGSDEMPLTLITNSLVGLNLLEKLIINNLKLRLLKRDMFVGMPALKQLLITGIVTEIEFDAFLEINKIYNLQMSNCHIQNISMDSFIGLSALEYLDLSRNLLSYLPPGVFDHLTNIKEIYLNGNKFQHLPHEIFAKIHPKLIRLNENPWDCSCEMSDWKPLIINKIKQRVVKSCAYSHDKGLSCDEEPSLQYRYIYENKVAPKCASPEEFLNWNIFYAMRKILKCPDYKPKLRRHPGAKYTTLNSYSTTGETITEIPKIKIRKIRKHRKHLLYRKKLAKFNASTDSSFNDINSSHSLQTISSTNHSTDLEINNSIF